MLEEIAANDYGDEIPDHLAAIEQQLSDDPHLGLLGWCPREVLELEKNGLEPDAALPSGWREHVKRLLACALLLQSAATVTQAEMDSDPGEVEFFLDTLASTLISLTRSAISLGVASTKYTLCFTVWLHDNLYAPIRPFNAFCVLCLWLEYAPTPRPSCIDIEQAIQWVVEEERECRELYARNIYSELWLVGLSIYEDRDGDRTRWIESGRQALQKMDKCPEAANQLRSLLGRMERK